MAKTVSITKKPTGKVSSMSSPTRTNDGWGLRFDCSWKVPSSLTSTSSNSRATNIQICWAFGLGWKKNPEFYWSGGTGYTSSRFGISGGWDIGKWNNVKAFYPYTSVKLWNIHCWVRAYNSKGYGPWTHTYRAIGKPPKPTMTAAVQNEQTGVVSTTVKQDRATKANNPCQYTRYAIWVKDTRVANKWVKKKDTYTTASEFTLSYDVNDRMHLNYDQYVQIDFYTWAYGFNGYTDNVKRSLVVSYPAKAVINGIDAKSKSPTEKVTVRINTKSTGTHYVTGCKLQTLINTDYQKASDIPSDANWQDTSIVDNASCTALSIGVSDLKPAAGKTSWVRIKTWNQFEDMFYRYSEPMRVTALETPVPTAADDEIDLLQVTPDTDGTSAIALIGWNADGKDDSDFTEITWSENEHAWRSTEAPQNYEFEWSDGALSWKNPETGKTTNYKASASVHLENLEEGIPYYVKVRRGKDTDGVRTYSPYSGPLVVQPTITPPDVKLVAPSFVARGNSLVLNWVLSSDAEQTSWDVLLGTITSSVDVDESTNPPTATVVETFTETNVVAHGDDAAGSCVIDGERLASLLGTSGSAAFAVRVSTGGEYITSTGATVSIADPPEIDHEAQETIAAQGYSFTVKSTVEADITCVITAQGAQGEFPGGEQSQIAGDTVYSDVLSPEWEASGTDGWFETVVTLPTGLDFWDGAKYSVSLKATDTNTALESAIDTFDVGVVWAHQAPAPSDDIVVTPKDEIDADGFRTRSATVQLVAPTGAAEGDTYEVYRVTPDGSYLIAQEQALDAQVIDLYAPYGAGEHVYRVATRTADGDVDWLDFDYELPGKDLRIDFGSQYVELPYNLTIGDSFTKDFEARSHLGQSVAQGYWNENVSRRSSLSTDLIKITDRSVATTLRSLARYGAPVFVRTPNGCAYQANIEVSGLDESYDSGAIAVALDGEEIELTEQYKSQVPERTQDTDPSEEENSGGE